ncbi:TlpA family protein disulfide reductase [Aminipila sp.]|uniref:TlpA family protein disulfide reductase n=1 Tax=Aminipila sp. TaxID=2060095 RepID=UPI0028A20D8E|nr:TlpA disulfide reductase family protein [Aminipila sp.]
MKKLFLLLVISVLTVSLFTGCSQPNFPTYTNGTKDNTSIKETLHPVASSNGQLGNFQAQDVNGNAVTNDIFSNYDLTLVNLFTTWCSPCIKEIPELDAVRKEMADKNVNVIGIVLDVNEDGKIDEDKMDRLKQIIESTKAQYTMVIPDEVLRSGRLKGVNSVPETFFVDKNGNIVGETYLGSHTKEEWIKIIEDELAKLNK